MDDDSFINEFSIRLRELRIEHRNLDIEITHLLEETSYVDQLLVQRLKKRKLWLKDTIVKLESKKIPDLDA
jgi:hypothetical protein